MPKRGGREPASLLDSDAVPSDLLSQQFFWLTFSHWKTNSVNCGRHISSYTNEKQGTAALFASQKPGCLQCFQTQPSRLPGFSVHRSDRTKELPGKSRGGGVCFFINNSWCDERNLHSIKSFCSPDLEFHMLLCRPLWLPKEFTSIIITDVFIPPQANTDQAFKELYGNISEQETVHPDCLCTQIALVVTGHFTKANFRTIAPKYFQHITINKRSDRAMDHCYSPFWDAYKSLPHFRQIGSHDDTTVISLITENDETAYREEVRTMTKWCQKNHLSLNIDKTKELVVDFRISKVIQPSPSTRHLWSG